MSNITRVTRWSARAIPPVGSRSLNTGASSIWTYGISDDKEHVVCFSFKDEFVGDYPACLSGLPAQITIKATMPSRVIRVTGEQLNQFFDQNIETTELRSLIAEHMTGQFHLHYQNLYCATPRERYELLLHRYPGIIQNVALQDIASFLNIAPTYLGKLRKEIHVPSAPVNMTT